MKSSDDFVDELLVLVGFLLTSARGLLDEPQSYGPARLFDAAGRLLAIMDERGVLDDSLREIRVLIDEERFGAWAEEDRLAKLDDIAVRWTESVAGRFSG